MLRGFPNVNWYRHIALPGILGSAVFGALVIVSGARDFVVHISDLPWALVPGLLALSLGNYALRALRWVLFLRFLNQQAPLSILIKVFIAGLSMSASPGKVGEFLKGVWLNGLCAVPISKTTAAVVWERVLDFVVMALLALGAIALATWALPLVGIGLGVMVLILVAALLAPSLRGHVVVLLRHPRLNRLTLVYEALGQLGSPRVMVAAIPLSLVAWCLEGFSLWIILNALGPELPLYQAMALYALATLAGALSLLPGGLGSTEVVLVGLLISVSVPGAEAATATVIVRAATLWFAIALGVIALPLVLRDLRSARVSPTHRIDGS